MSHQRPRTGLELIHSTVRDVFNECADENEAYDLVRALVFVSVDVRAPWRAGGALYHAGVPRRGVRRPGRVGLVRDGLGDTASLGRLPAQW